MALHLSHCKINLHLDDFLKDAIKSKIQTDAFQKDKQLFKGISDCVIKTYRQSGIAGFYRGFWPCILRASPVNAAAFVAYESALKYLN